MLNASNTAILILTCNDFEALEITINQILKTTPQDIRIYLLSNGKGLPGADVCEQINRIAAHAQYERIIWINPTKRQPAYYSIRDALRTKIKEEYIIKIDDDVFPVKENWFQELTKCYEEHKDMNLAYVSAMVNNNPYGFSELVKLPELQHAYAKAVPFPHLTGVDAAGYREHINAPGTVDAGGWGTIWQFPQLVRWLHEETTLQPQRYATLIQNLPDARFDASIRYSINVMLFKRELWEDMWIECSDDEEMVNKYCATHNKKIFISRKTPFVHLYFGPQKKFLADMIPDIRKVYGPMNQVAGNEIVREWNTLRIHEMYSRQMPRLRKNKMLPILFGVQSACFATLLLYNFYKIIKK